MFLLQFPVGLWGPLVNGRGVKLIDSTTRRSHEYMELSLYYPYTCIPWCLFTDMENITFWRQMNLRTNARTNE